MVGCATVTAESYTVDNKKIYGIDCSGKMVSKEYCYQKAAELCPNGYKVLEEKAPTVFANEPATSDTMTGLKIAEEFPWVRKGISVKCN
jgi:precorrin-6B methylase 2